MKDALIVSALSLLPRNRAASAMGGLARSSLSAWLTRAFVRVYGVNLDEATGGLADYPTLESLFTRELREGVRPVDPTPEALVSPVDGKVAAVGTTVGGCIEVAPGRPLDVNALLGVDGTDEYEVAVLYLSPTDYHRVHVPREGAAVDWSYLPGTLWPVFPAAVRRVDHLFSRNERLRVGLSTDRGRIEVVLVGAFGVGRISVGFTDLLSNDGHPATSETLDPAVPVERAGWLGTFHLGSTVILALAPGSVQWACRPGEAVRLGRSIGTLVTP